MSKQEVAAFLIMESAMEPARPQNVQVVENNGLFYVNFDTVLQRTDTLNRNNRSYVGKFMDISLAQDHITELVRENTWLGEAGHPDSEKVSRILTIDPTNTSHRINKFWREGDLIKGNIDTLDDDGVGRKMTKSILQKVEPAFSLRAMASLTKKPNGTSLMQSRAHLVTYDWVILPSHKEAYRDKSKDIKAFGMPDKNITTESGIIIPVKESTLIDFVQMESTNLNLVSDICEIAMESMQISSDFSNVILKENGRTFIVPIEEKIKTETRNYMSKFF